MRVRPGRARTFMPSPKRGEGVGGDGRCESRESADLRLVDGYELGASVLVHERIVQGDGTSATIAAASIVAKVARDRLMASLEIGVHISEPWKKQRAILLRWSQRSCRAGSGVRSARASPT